MVSSSSRKIIAGLVAILFSITIQAQYDFSKVKTWVQDNLPELGGRAALVIYKEGKIIYSQFENDLSRKQKMIGKIIAKRQGKEADEVLQDYKMDSRQAIASCSKWLSAALVMTFVDEGKLSLDDTVGKYLPVMTANGKGNITIWQCLSHTTGIKTGTLKDSRETATTVETMDESIALIAAFPMEGEPGTTFHYSSAGLQIAAAVIEKISGKSFTSLFAERIAKPCNMLNTDFGDKKVPLPAGGARSTPQDYINFLTMILNNGKFKGKQVLSANSVAAMQKNYAKGAKVLYSPANATATGWGYGLGEWIMDDADKRSNAVTSPGAFGSFPWVDNEKGYAGFLFVFNLKSEGRGKKLIELKQLTDEAITGKAFPQ